LRTRRFTVVPSRQRSTGAGSEPLTVIAGRVRPVKIHRRLADDQVEVGPGQHVGIAGTLSGPSSSAATGRGGNGAAQREALHETAARQPERARRSGIRKIG
jgi:hypothetical protein